MKNCGIHALETQPTFIITNINFYIVADMWIKFPASKETNLLLQHDGTFLTTNISLGIAPYHRTGNWKQGIYKCNSFIQKGL